MHTSCTWWWAHNRHKNRFFRIMCILCTICVQIPGGPMFENYSERMDNFLSNEPYSVKIGHSWRPVAQFEFRKKIWKNRLFAHFESIFLDFAQIGTVSKQTLKGTSELQKSNWKLLGGSFDASGLVAQTQFRKKYLHTPDTPWKCCSQQVQLAGNKRKSMKKHIKSIFVPDVYTFTVCLVCANTFFRNWACDIKSDASNEPPTSFQFDFWSSDVSFKVCLLTVPICAKSRKIDSKCAKSRFFQNFFETQIEPQGARNVRFWRYRAHLTGNCPYFPNIVQTWVPQVSVHMWHTKGTLCEKIDFCACCVLIIIIMCLVCAHKLIGGAHHLKV